MKSLILQEQRFTELLLISTFISQIGNRVRRPGLSLEDIEAITLRILDNLAGEVVAKYWDSGLIDKQVEEESQRQITEV